MLSVDASRKSQFHVVFQANKRSATSNCDFCVSADTLFIEVSSKGKWDKLLLCYRTALWSYICTSRDSRRLKRYSRLGYFDKMGLTLMTERMQGAQV